jgi:exonuclease III
LYFLQETHIKSKDENFMRSCWGFDVLFAGDSTNRNGVGILFNNNFEFQVHNVVKDVNGCYIIVDIEMLKERFTLLNIYGPSSGDNPEFFANVFNLVKEIGNDKVITAGDFNCSISMDIDVRNYLSSANRPRTRRKLKELMAEYELSDVWRELHPNVRRYTWRKFNSVKQARLDYFLISDCCVPDVLNCVIETGHRSDHSLVTLIFKTTDFKRDRPFWKFNNSLLYDKKYVDEIKKVILQVKKNNMRLWSIILII